MDARRPCHELVERSPRRVRPLGFGVRAVKGKRAGARGWAVTPHCHATGVARLTQAARGRGAAPSRGGSGWRKGKADQRGQPVSGGG
jgi:hypothetical protein